MHQFKNQIFNTIFVDVETVSQKKEWKDLSSAMRNLWRHKAKSISRHIDLELTDELIKDLYHDKAAIYAEFGKIVCISIGMFYRDKGIVKLYTKSFYGHNERDILQEFLQLVSKKFNDANKFYFCGHNLREFDIPFICRRSLVHGLKLPSILEISGKKAWQLNHLLDTLQLWKFGDYKHYTSLELMCAVFEIESPKCEMDGSKIGDTYYVEKNLEKIKVYCEQDVKAVAFLFAKMIGRGDIYQNQKEEREIRNLESMTTSLAS